MDKFEIATFGVCIVAVVIVVLVVISALTRVKSPFETRNAIVQECLANEQYTREECIVLASGSK